MWKCENQIVWIESQHHSIFFGTSRDKIVINKLCRTHSNSMLGRHIQVERYSVIFIKAIPKGLVIYNSAVGGGRIQNDMTKI